VCVAIEAVFAGLDLDQAHREASVAIAANDRVPATWIERMTAVDMTS
jgi:hypothetical protein